MVYDPAAIEALSLKLIVAVLVKSVLGVKAVISKLPKAPSKSTVGFAQVDVLISVTDRVAVPSVPICKLLFETLALNAGVGVAGATDTF
jgi:hypothetical protein